MRGKFVTDNHTTRHASQHIVFDCETFDAQTDKPGTVAQRFRLACATAWRFRGGKQTARKTVVARSVRELQDWILERLSTRRSTWIWAHNLPYDFTVAWLWDWLDNGTFSTRSPAQSAEDSERPAEESPGRDRGYLCFSDPPTILSGWVQGKRCVFVDSLNWLRTSLAKIGEQLGIPKGTLPDKDSPDEEWVKYCQRDVEILERAVLELCSLVRDHDLGVMKPTAAAQSWAHWRHMPDRPQVQIPDNKREARLARRAYYGGRCECYYRGRYRGKVYSIDMNSAYAWAMIAKMQPFRLISYVDFARVQDLRSLEDGPCMSAHVRLRTADIAMPVRTASGTIYATGEFWTDLCGADLFVAYERGMVEEVGALAMYGLCYVNHDFAEFWVDARRKWRAEGNGVLEALAKHMPCALYGHWASREHQWERIGDLDDGRRWGSMRWRNHLTGRWHPGRIIAGESEVDMGRSIYCRQTRDGPELGAEGRVARDCETESSFPAISAWITAAVRQRMELLRRIAGERQCLYQCVDSLLVTEDGYSDLCESGAINTDSVGALKLAATYDDVVIYAPNLLRLDGKLVASGLPGTHVEAPDGSISATYFERLAGILSRGPDGSVRVTQGQWRPPAALSAAEAEEGRWCETVRIVQ